MPKKSDIHERLNGNYTYNILIDDVLWRCSSGFICVEKQDNIRNHTCNGHTYLFEIMETEPVPFLCSILLLLTLLLFIWVKIPPTPEELQQEDSPVRALLSEIEGLLLMLYEIAYGEDIKTFIWAILYVAIIYTIGSYINLLTIFYICLVCLLTIPVMYLQYQEVVDDFIGEVSEMKNKTLQLLNCRATKKKKKLY
ncbi:LOW QUALITY PROTEIN: hypothetical protein HID58_048868 [Brassica napus]|uniref:Reticulon-like protein n=1 Tax=Brassica napus TaxID=3708 RepID=A0ABQ8B3D3_BRANA|nr:LOW QUALITY PROTEIN: hypothetical protein HID58_048868 [Brassica napus]